MKQCQKWVSVELSVVRLGREKDLRARIQSIYDQQANEQLASEPCNICWGRQRIYGFVWGAKIFVFNSNNKQTNKKQFLPLVHFHLPVFLFAPNQTPFLSQLSSGELSLFLMKSIVSWFSMDSISPPKSQHFSRALLQYSSLLTNK